MTISQNLHLIGIHKDQGEKAVHHKANNKRTINNEAKHAGLSWRKLKVVALRSDMETYCCGPMPFNRGYRNLYTGILIMSGS